MTIMCREQDDDTGVWGDYYPVLSLDISRLEALEMCNDMNREYGHLGVYYIVEDGGADAETES